MGVSNEEMIERLEKDLKEKETLEDFDPTDREPNAKGGLTRTSYAMGGGRDTGTIGEMKSKLGVLSNKVRRTSKRLEERGEPAFLEMGRGPVLPSDEDPINPFGPKPTRPVLPDKSMMASSDSYQNYVRAALELGLKPIRIDEFESLTPIMDVNEILNLTEQLNRSKNATGGLAGIINL